MRALVHDPDAPHGLRLGEAPDPEPGPSDAIVQVAATSLNFGEVAFLRERVAPGAVAGWDASGTVLAAAADGSGPPTGARVATFGWSGAWAQRRAVDTGELAVLPDAVEFGAAAAIPVAGVTALRALRRLGSVVGRRVLITGASGGVGRFAVQLAARAGAHVVAAVGSPARGEGLAQLGASEVVVGLSDVAEPVDAALDNVGGQVLAEVLARLAPGGCVVSVGMASLQPTTIDFEQLRMRAGGQPDRGVHGRPRLRRRPAVPGLAARGRRARPADRVARLVGSRRRGSRCPDRTSRPGQGRPRGRAMTLAGQRVVVVGGTSGMGLATVRAAAAQGAEVIAAGRRSVAGRVQIDGVLQAEVDVTDETSVRALFDGVGTLDHLFVSASPGAPGPFLEQDLTAARTFIDGKLLGSWTCARYAAPLMRAGGSITFVTGVAVVRPPGTPRW